jgi:hypothetical protein
MYVLFNILARLRNHCFCGNAAMHSVCVAELRVTVNNTKMNVAQECFYGEFMSLATKKSI